MVSSAHQARPVCSLILRRRGVRIRPKSLRLNTAMSLGLITTVSQPNRFGLVRHHFGNRSGNTPLGYARGFCSSSFHFFQIRKTPAKEVRSWMKNRTSPNQRIWDRQRPILPKRMTTFFISTVIPPNPPQGKS